MAVKISLVTDELSADLETAVEIGNELGIDCFELRGLEGYRVGRLPGYLENLCLRMFSDENYDFNPVALSPGIFKEAVDRQPIPDKYGVLRWQYKDLYQEKRKSMTFFEDYLENVLPNTISLAKKLAVDKIIIFGVGRSANHKGKTPDYVYDYLKTAAKIAGEYGITLLIENEHICFVDTGRNAAEILNKVGADNLRLNWDPANAFCAGEVPFPDGYEYVKDFVEHVHFKDVAVNNGNLIYTLNGDIDWEGQIKSLKEDGYDGYISIETHCRPKIKSVKSSLERLGLIIKKL